jgi:hypothetical protein
VALFLQRTNAVPEQVKMSRMSEIEKEGHFSWTVGRLDSWTKRLKVFRPFIL